MFYCLNFFFQLVSRFSASFYSKTSQKLSILLGLNVSPLIFLYIHSNQTFIFTVNTETTISKTSVASFLLNQMVNSHILSLDINISFLLKIPFSLLSLDIMYSSLFFYLDDYFLSLFSSSSSQRLSSDWPRTLLIFGNFIQSHGFKYHWYASDLQMCIPSLNFFPHF